MSKEHLGGQADDTKSLTSVTVRAKMLITQDVQEFGNALIHGIWLLLIVCGKHLETENRRHSSTAKHPVGILT